MYTYTRHWSVICMGNARFCLHDVHFVLMVCDFNLTKIDRKCLYKHENMVITEYKSGCTIFIALLRLHDINIKIAMKAFSC